MNSIKTALILEIDQNTTNNGQGRARYIIDKIEYCNKRINSSLEQLIGLKSKSYYYMEQEESEQNTYAVNQLRAEMRTLTTIIKELINLI